MGGEFNGEWTDKAETFNILTQKSEEMSPLVDAMFGPTMICVNDDKPDKHILYCVGLSLKRNLTIIQKWTEETNKWEVIAPTISKGTDYVFGFCGFAYQASSQKFFIFGGIDKSYENVSEDC